MTEPRPLLAFGPPTQGAIPRVTTRPPFRPVTTPNASRQGIRLTPQFQELHAALAAKRASLSMSAAESDPELVVVFDLAGSAERFVRAIAGIPGLDFLAELDEDLLPPDEDFYYSSREGEALDVGVPQSLYMVMSNEQAVTELVRLFELWLDDPAITFERGLGGLKEVFPLLRAVRRWGPSDRVRETGLLEVWAEDIRVVGASGRARVEIELWFRSEQAQRIAAERAVEDILNRHGGRLLTRGLITEVAYHGLLADVPYAQVEHVLAEGPEAIELLTAESVMFVSPAKPMQFPRLAADFMQQDRLPELGPPPSGPPRVGLLDGLPLANHVALRGCLIIDDADDRAANYPVARQCHGTAMASLLSHGDLSAPGPPLSSRIYVRPILQPHEFAEDEVTPPGELLIDLIHRAFQRMFEEVRNRDAAAPSVRIINLSIGDPVRQFARILSPLAKLLDWLAHKYNLVVVVSAGNHSVKLENIPTAALADHEALKTCVIQTLHEKAPIRRIISPAEAINAVTVGASHSDESQIDQYPDTVIDCMPVGAPAGYSPVGFGFRRSVKPDVMFPGGRMLYVRPTSGSSDVVTLDSVRSSAVGPGILVAAPGLTGELDGTCFTHGTSNAAALASRSVNRIFDLLEDLAAAPGEFPFPSAEYYPVLAKALLAHAAGWGEVSKELNSALKFPKNKERRSLTQILGYGSVDAGRLGTAARNRVVLLGAGSIAKDKRHSYRFPLPNALVAATEWRRLTLTLAWLSPVNPRSQKYRVARLFFTPPQDELALSLVEAEHNAVQKGTIRHQIMEGSAAVAYTPGSSLAIDVDCRVDTGRLTAPARYGLVASLEVAASVQADIHGQVRQSLRAQVQERLRSRVTARS
jgi:hypothetical protein